MVRRFQFLGIEGNPLCLHIFPDHVDRVLLCRTDRAAAVKFAFQALFGDVQHAECECQFSGLLIAYLDPQSGAKPVTVRHQMI